VIRGEHAQVVLVADEDQSVIRADDPVLEGEGGGGHGFRRPHVTAHAIKGDTVAFLRSGFGHEIGLSPGWSLSSGVQDLATAILTRGRVDAVGATKGAGFGILDEFRGAELVGATTESAAAFGLFTFRVGHGSTLG